MSLLRTGLYTLHTDLAIQLFFGRIASTRPRAEAYNPLTNFFRTKDDAWICIVARAGKADLPRMARAFDLPGIDTDPRFQDGNARRDNAAAITAMFDEAFARFTKDEMAARLTAEEIAWAPAQTLADVAVDPRFTQQAASSRRPARTASAASHLLQLRRASRALMTALRGLLRSWANTRGRCWPASDMARRRSLRCLRARPWPDPTDDSAGFAR